MSFGALTLMACVIVFSSCTNLQAAGQEDSSNLTGAPNKTLVGAWEVTAFRAGGVGKNLLTFSSDGTFFRSGDTHPVVSGGHGAWKLTGPNQYNASYVSFSFDQNGKWIGINRNNLQLSLSPDGDQFEGSVKTSNRDLEDNVISKGISPLAGKRIQVQPF